MLSLIWPWMLALLPLPLLASRVLPAAPSGAALQLPASIGVEFETSSARPARSLSLWLVWILLVLAASRPTWLGEPVSLPASGRDIVLAVDLSGSMDERDISYRGRAMQRLAVVQAVAGDFIQRRVGDRLGLVLFGENAYLQSPLSLDRATTKQLLDESEVGLAGQKTAIGDAIGLSVRHLLEQGRNEDKLVVLLTDGESNAGHISPDKAAELAAQSGVRVHTIGFSGEQKVQMGFFVQTLQSPIDTDTLKRVAATTGGRFFSAQSVAELEQIYGLIDEIEPVEVDELNFRPQVSLFHWPLGVAVLFACLGLALRVRGAG